jgi:hypothetical protein
MTTAVITPEQPRFRLSETLKNFGVDIALFLMFIVDMNTHLTGIPVHEWLGLVFGGALIYHLLLHWQWITVTTCNLFRRLPTIQRLRYLVDLLLFIDLVIVVVTGIWISRAALPQLGLPVLNGSFWNRLHHTSADSIIFLVGLHLALSWPWIINAWRRYVWTPLTGRGRDRLADETAGREGGVL